jgi:hypothetical protein
MATKTDTTPRCPEITWSGYQSYVCGRPIKRNGKCGIHAAAAERRERNDRERDEKERADRAVRNELLQFMEQNGINGSVMQDRWTGAYKITVSRDELERLLGLDR